MLIFIKKLVYVAANIPNSAVELQEKNENYMNSETKSSSELKKKKILSIVNSIPITE